MFMSHAAERVSFKVNPTKTRSILKTNSGKLVMKVGSVKRRIGNAVFGDWYVVIAGSREV